MNRSAIVAAVLALAVALAWLWQGERSELGSKTTHDSAQTTPMNAGSATQRRGPAADDVSRAAAWPPVRPVAARPPPLPTGNAVELAEQYEAKLAADPAAGYQLYRVLSVCHDLFMALREEKTAALRGEKTNLENVGGMTAAQDGLVSATAAGEVLQCTGLDEKKMSQRLAALEQSARAGYLLAQIEYRSALMQLMSDQAEVIRNPSEIARVKENIVSFLMDAARRGSPEGMYWLATIYEEGIIAPRDLESAYAYRLASAQSRPWGVSRYDEQTLARYAQELSRAQLENAKQRAAQLLRTSG